MIRISEALTRFEETDISGDKVAQIAERILLRYVALKKQRAAIGRADETGSNSG